MSPCKREYANGVMLAFRIGLVTSAVAAMALHLGGLQSVPSHTDITVGATSVPAAVSRAAVTVHDWTTLHAAVTGGAPEVFIPGNVTITVPNQARAVQLLPEQRLISDRALNTRGGAIVVPPKNGANNYPVITMATRSAIEGLRVLGPNAGYDTENTTIGIQTVPGSTGVLVRGSELAGWSWAAVSVKQSTDAVVDDNDIHDNIRAERGYGVVTQNGDATALIRSNVFNRNRHAIAGSGEPGEVYTAERNLIRQGGGSTAYHQFDMHVSSAGIGGAYVTIRNNVFDYGRYGTANRSSINIRGIPSTGPATVTNNTFTQSWNVGTQTAITGALGATEPSEALQQENAFDQTITYTRTPSGCTAATANVHMTGPCTALE